jgi:hypothetical protein
MTVREEDRWSAALFRVLRRVADALDAHGLRHEVYACVSTLLENGGDDDPAEGQGGVTF